jgi:hypothetical protein
MYKVFFKFIPIYNTETWTLTRRNTSKNQNPRNGYKMFETSEVKQEGTEFGTFLNIYRRTISAKTNFLDYRMAL